MRATPPHPQRVFMQQRRPQPARALIQQGRHHHILGDERGFEDRVALHCTMGLDHVTPLLGKLIHAGGLRPCTVGYYSVSGA